MLAQGEAAPSPGMPDDLKYCCWARLGLAALPTSGLSGQRRGQSCKKARSPSAAGFAFLKVAIPWLRLSSIPVL